MLHSRSQRAEGDENPDEQLAVKFHDDYCVLLKSHHVFPLEGFLQNFSVYNIEACEATGMDASSLPQGTRSENTVRFI